jgi:hypothetical protein
VHFLRGAADNRCSKLLVREQTDKKAAVESQARVEREVNELRAKYSSARGEAETHQKVSSQLGAEQIRGAVMKFVSRRPQRQQRESRSWRVTWGTKVCQWLR